MDATLGQRNADTAIQVIADTRTNRLILVGPPTVRQRLVDLARRLDTPATANLDNARVIRLRYSDAKQLAEVLETMGRARKPPRTIGGGRRNRPLVRRSLSRQMKARMHWC